MTSHRRHVPNRFLINQCQIITFLILKYDIIENSRIELTGIVLPVQVGGLLGGGQMHVGPPSQIIGGPGPPCPPPLFLRLCFITPDDALASRAFSALINSLESRSRSIVSHNLGRSSGKSQMNSQQSQVDKA